MNELLLEKMQIDEENEKESEGDEFNPANLLSRAKKIVKTCSTHFLEAFIFLRPNQWIFDLRQFDKSVRNLKRYFEVVDYEQIRYDLLFYLDNIEVLFSSLPKGDFALVCCKRVLLIKDTLSFGQKIMTLFRKLCEIKLINLTDEMNTRLKTNNQVDCQLGGWFWL